MAAATLAGLGYAVARRAAGNPVGWCFLVAGLVAGLAAVASAASQTWPFFGWVHAWTPWLVYAFIPIPLLLFPDGRLPSRRWRPALRLAQAGLLLPAAALAFAAGLQPDVMVDLDTPPPRAAAVALGVAALGAMCALAAFLLSLGALARRWSSAVGDQRQQLKWLALGGAGTVVGLVLDAAALSGAWLVAATAVPVSAAVAVLRYRLYDIDLFINRTITYGIVGVLILLASAVMIPLAAATVSRPNSMGALVVATALLVLLVDPVRRHVQHAVDAALRGDTSDPYAAVSNLNRTFVSTVDSQGVLTSVVENIAASLRLPYVAVAIDAGGDEPELTVTGRPPVAATESFVMRYQGLQVGVLVVARRSPREALTARERELLGVLAGQAGIAAHAAGLARQVQMSRERLRRDVEEERRKLRHDLHDSLGPTLAGLIMQVGAARASTGPASPTRVAAVMSDLELGLSRCVEDVRALINGLHRPPALDQVGLLAALREKGETFGTSTFQVCVKDASLPPLPAAVEVAAYRIAMEALTNVVKHAGARRAEVVVESTDDGLHLAVTDDGVGFDPRARLGEGLHSMRERAQELGGRSMVHRAPGGGTTAEAWLPLHGESRR